MIYLKNDILNKVALTLNESNLISGTPTFLFEFIREWDKQVFTFSYSDNSTTEIYNLFFITLSGSASATQSGIDEPVNMVPGQYIYNIYDTLTESMILDGYIQNGYFEEIVINNLLETGMLIVEKKDIGTINQNPQNIYY
jgi:hypothetical protein